MRINPAPKSRLRQVINWLRNDPGGAPLIILDEASTAVLRWLCAPGWMLTALPTALHTPTPRPCFEPPPPACHHPLRLAPFPSLTAVPQGQECDGQRRAEALQNREGSGGAAGGAARGQAGGACCVLSVHCWQAASREYTYILCAFTLLQATVAPLPVMLLPALPCPAGAAARRQGALLLRHGGI